MVPAFFYVLLFNIYFLGRSLCFLFFLFVGNIIGGGVLAVSGLLLWGLFVVCFFVHLCVCIHKFLFTIFGWVVCLFLLFVLPILIILIFIVCFLQKIRRP